MRLFAGSCSDFITLNIKRQLAPLLKKEFLKQLGYNPSHNEMMSWQNSLLNIAVVFQQSEFKEQGVFIEYRLPLSGRRIDVIICGKDSFGRKNAVIIELKQWDHCSLTDYDSDYVLTWVGGGYRAVLHPSVQVGNYKYYLQENSSVFYEGEAPVLLHACSYLHNYTCDNSDPIFDIRFKDFTEKFPLYTADHTEALSVFLRSKVLSEGGGMDILAEIEESKLRPSKKLLQQVSSVIKEKLNGELKIFGDLKSKGDYILLDEQLIVYDTIMSIIKKGISDKQKFAIIVKGGAGTGKSVIALQLLADLTALGKNAHFVTGSKSFTETLRKILGPESKNLLKYSMSYGEAHPNDVDILIMDEAHRLRKTTPFPFKSSGRLQIEDLINASRISVFFIDDHQNVRKGEIGSSEFIREHALSLNCKTYEYELEGQFRCGGSEAYTNWIDNTLQIRRTANVLWKNEETFEFKIFSSPQELETAIRTKNNAGFSGRLMAGFCWPWSNQLNPDKSLIADIQIDEYRRPWNAREGLNGMKKEIPKSQYWAYDINGIDQIGCVYTAQGFEFDYAGVIIGTDLIYNPDASIWEGHPKNSFDSQVKGNDFTQLVKNTYRVLLSRGMKGCYVYFMDKETERFFKSRIEKI